MRHLTLLQIDPTAAVAPTADLVAWSRLGATHSQADLVSALAKRSLVELWATIRPAEDVTLYRAEMTAARGDAAAAWQQRRREWLTANDACRRDILARLGAEGPLPSRLLPDTCAVPWRSTGWTNDQNVIRLLDIMSVLGEVAVAGRLGRERLWDLAERVYPDDPPVPLEEALRRRDARRLTALGIARAKTTKVPIEPYDVGAAGEPAVVEGVKGTWRVDPVYLDGHFAGRTALLSPFDRLVHDRRRLLELFGFDYGLEMYKPAAKRRWGYYALPILHGDRLIGKLDATADRKAGVLRVAAIHEDEPFDGATAAAVDEEIAGLATWLGLEVRHDREAA
ncbi:crosslink repair DNA glycosylase YcaQ family protein [Asanoa sp. WMMD1127]|uniref:DNA glycosylase AlkZ-like family protein n=1 Tax=Asanoa sp. WMMD1127 TaxID=3016107 RepID=UPI0024160E45|nr:crosslink repair DNA glycosylase YcaQ family protein [Asanoa sp. WMMD1127]MDG4824068.1 crosslink repair DNA glycosylase YcaQ family protein [Asanoa sp. WMMD1127]